MATSDLVTGDRFKTALTGFKQYCESTYVKPTVATTLSGNLTVTGEADIAPNGKYIFMGGNNSSFEQKRIYFTSTDNATYPHNIYLYGGSGDSNVGFGIYNAATSKAVWRYYDQDGYKYVQCTKPFSEHTTTIHHSQTAGSTLISWSSQTEQKIPFDTTISVRPEEGTRTLYRTSGGVKIVEDVTYVEASGQVYIEGACTGTVFVYIYKNDTVVAEHAHSFYKDTGGNYTYNVPPVVISVTAEDMIYLKVKARSGHSITTYVQPKSYLTVTALG